MSKKGFDRSKMQAYAKEAEERWGDTDAYRESRRKTAGKTENELRGLGKEMMCIFREFTPLLDTDPASAEAQQVVAELQQFITEHYYTCTKPILSTLGQMYTADARFRENIDSTCGEGTASFASEAIAAFCQ